MVRKLLFHHPGEQLCVLTQSLYQSVLFWEAPLKQKARKLPNPQMFANHLHVPAQAATAQLSDSAREIT